MVNKVIKFKDGRKFIVAKEAEMYGVKYVYCSLLDDKDMPTNNLVIYRVDGINFIRVDDEIELSEISKIFIEQIEMASK